MKLEEVLYSGINNSKDFSGVIDESQISLEGKISLIIAYIEILEHEKAIKLLNKIKKEIESNIDNKTNRLIITFLENKLNLLSSHFDEIYKNLKHFSIQSYSELSPKEKTYLILILFIRAEALFRLGKHDQSLKELEIILEKVENSKQHPSLPYDVIKGLYCRIAFMNYYFLGQLDKGQEMIDKGLAIYTKTNNYVYLAYFNNFQGIICALKGYYYTALDSYQKCIEYFDSININQEKGVKYTAAINSNIASILAEQGRLHEAIEITKKSLAIYEQLQSENDVANLLNSLGNYYRDLRDFQKAEDYLFKAYLIRKKGSDTFQISESLVNICILEEKLGSLSADSICNTEFPENVESEVAIAHKYFIKGLTSLAIKNYEEAHEFLEKALLAEALDFSFRNIINDYLAEIYLEKNDFFSFKNHLKKWKARAKRDNLIPSLFKAYLIDFRFELIFSNFMQSQVSLDRAKEIAKNYSLGAQKLVEENFNLLEKRRLLIDELKDSKETSLNEKELKKKELQEIKTYIKEIASLLTTNA